MSMIAAVLFAGLAADPTPRTAEAVLEAHRARTTIGPDPCRSREPGEIVVCARDRAEFSTSLYDKDPDQPRYGGERVDQMQAIKDITSPCGTQGIVCKGGINVLEVGRFVIGGIRALLGKDD